jgi:hypothetical protein
MAIRAPAEAKASTIARPMPDVPPVMRTTRLRTEAEGAVDSMSVASSGIKEASRPIATGCGKNNVANPPHFDNGRRSFPG